MKEKDEGFVCFTDNDRINHLLNKLVSDVREFTEEQLCHIRQLTMIGAALSAERKVERLFEMIVDEAIRYTRAEGGTLYIMSDDETVLQFTIVQNDTLNVRMGGTSGNITWPPVMLKNTDGSPNYANVSAYAAISGEVVNIPDVYNASGFNFEGTRKFDAETGYRSRSMLVVPMRNYENDIIGVLQLLNAVDTVTGEVTVFSLENQKMAESLASQAAVALSSNRLIYDLENLLESFIKTIAAAIDEKSPYTGGHIRRVAGLTMAIAKKINEAREVPYADVYFNEDQMEELRIAAWLHDVGKITTPEYIIDKATKLEAKYDRIELLKTRFEIIKRDNEIELLKKIIQKSNPDREVVVAEDDTFIEALKEDINFLVAANSGSEYLDDEMIEKLKSIGQRQWLMDGKPQPLLNDNEIYNLSIRRGTLAVEERNIINNHVALTHKMLSQLPFPKKLRHVPDYAAAHHEKLDGTGYPSGLKGDQLSLQSRILALADVFEALISDDRPYKKENTVPEAMQIMELMVKDHHLDSDLFDLFVKEHVYDCIKEETGNGPATGGS
ncbi:MAG: HD domain-containing phosphohydrolase [Syntrophales bacterium]